MLPEVIQAEANALVTIKHKTGGAYDADGHWIALPLAEELLVPIVIQPVSGKILRDLAEGERVEAEFALWTLSALAVDDVVIYGGAQYRVLRVWPRPEGGYTKAVIGKLA